jgi:hypothetical protein
MNVREGHIASIFGVEDKAMEDTSIKVSLLTVCFILASRVACFLLRFGFLLREFFGPETKLERSEGLATRPTGNRQRNLTVCELVRS